MRRFPRHPHPPCASLTVGDGASTSPFPPCTSLVHLGHRGCPLQFQFPCTSRYNLGRRGRRPLRSLFTGCVVGYHRGYRGCRFPSAMCAPYRGGAVQGSGYICTPANSYCGNTGRTILQRDFATVGRDHNSVLRYKKEKPPGWMAFLFGGAGVIMDEHSSASLFSPSKAVSMSSSGIFSIFRGLLLALTIRVK